MQSHYKINVSKNGQHYFATAPHSLVDEKPAMAAFADFVKRFPESEGFKVDCTYWEGRGTHIALPKEVFCLYNKLHNIHELVEGTLKLKQFTDRAEADAACAENNKLYAGWEVLNLRDL